ncbi:MAG: hypothetical protein QOE09_755 [Ilumatobacteraceae bacterium]|jgi:pimeloyl-ACP methyl ester carboxylesterase
MNHPRHPHRQRRVATVAFITALTLAAVASDAGLRAGAASGTTTAVQRTGGSGLGLGRQPGIPSDPRLRPIGAPPSGERAPLSREAARAPRTDTTPARRAIALGAQPCDDGSGALCGQFNVPLDRARHDGRTAGIDFKFYVHTDPGPAISTVWWNGGGPGPSTTRNDGWVPGYLLGDLLGTFDVLFTDVRGTGSTALDCPTLQLFEGYYPGVANHQPLADCAATIADRIDTYGSADSARDLDALRAALGIPKLDIIGNSYGAMPATAYALRFPQRTRSLILSSGVDVESTLVSKITDTARAADRILDMLCTRSPACRAGVPDARGALAAGVRRLHQSPLEGESVSANHPDVTQHVRFTEGMLFTLLEESDNTFMSAAGEVPAAMIALGHGDIAPALRLAADATDMFNVFPSDVPASINSGGGYSAIECSDYRLPWRPGVALDDRIDAAANSVRRLDVQRRIGAWSATTIVRTPEYADWEQLINCNRWPNVHAEPVVPDDSHYPRVPTLVITSDLDPRVPLEDAQRQAARWPRSQLLDIGGAMHGAALWACGPDRVRAFLRLPGSLQSPCDPAQLPAFRAVGEFPVTAADARPLDVDPSTTDSSTIADRRLAAVALETALDANSISTRQFSPGTGAGLRGGQAVSSVVNDQFRIDLVDDRFAVDVAVNGTMIYPFDGSSPTIDITFTTDNGSTGHLSVAANWTQGRSAAEPNVVPVTGQVDGRPIALLLPL